MLTGDDRGRVGCNAYCINITPTTKREEMLTSHRMLHIEMSDGIGETWLSITVTVKSSPKSIILYLRRGQKNMTTEFKYDFDCHFLYSDNISMIDVFINNILSKFPFY